MKSSCCWGTTPLIYSGRAGGGAEGVGIQLSIGERLAELRARSPARFPRGWERIWERNAAQLPRWRGTRRDGKDARSVVTCRFETREAM